MQLIALVFNSIEGLREKIRIILKRNVILLDNGNFQPISYL